MKNAPSRRLRRGRTHLPDLWRPRRKAGCASRSPLLSPGKEGADIVADSHRFHLALGDRSLTGQRGHLGYGKANLLTEDNQKAVDRDPPTPGEDPHGASSVSPGVRVFTSQAVADSVDMSVDADGLFPAQVENRVAVFSRLGRETSSSRVSGPFRRTFPRGAWKAPGGVWLLPVEA